MKIPKLFKKAAAFVMAAVTALSIMPATAFAAGDIGTIFFSHTYDSNGNAMRYNSSANIGGYTAGGTGNYKYRMFVDGENAFCIQPGVPLKTGNTLKKASSDTWNALSANQKKAVGLTAKRNNVPTVSSSAKLIAYGDPNLQDLVTGVENADTVSAYINIETPTGTIALKKTSEDGVVEGISFTIKGDNFNKTVKTGKDGSVSVEGLFPGTYTVTEQSIDRYEPQKTQTVTLIGGKTSTVTFSNTLKRGSLEIVKTSEDNLVEGMKFHLYGTSLSGLPVDEYAVTDKNGLAKFENVLISGDTPYVVEEVDTAVRYVVPASQTAPIEWNKVTKRSFDNVLKKFQVTVTKTDAETGSPQGDASLAGAVYGIYKGEELIDTYTTDENGQFTTNKCRENIGNRLCI